MTKVVFVSVIVSALMVGTYVAATLVAERASTKKYNTVEQLKNLVNRKAFEDAIRNAKTQEELNLGLRKAYCENCEAFGPGGAKAEIDFLRSEAMELGDKKESEKLKTETIGYLKQIGVDVASNQFDSVKDGEILTLQALVKVAGFKNQEDPALAKEVADVVREIVGVTAKLGRVPFSPLNAETIIDDGIKAGTSAEGLKSYFDQFETAMDLLEKKVSTSERARFETDPQGVVQDVVEETVYPKDVKKSLLEEYRLEEIDKGEKDPKRASRKAAARLDKEIKEKRKLTEECFF